MRLEQNTWWSIEQKMRQTTFVEKLPDCGKNGIDSEDWPVEIPTGREQHELVVMISSCEISSSSLFGRYFSNLEIEEFD